MSLDLSTRILDELSDHKDTISQVDMFALGEPLLDPHIFERIRYAKELGFGNIGISTNADPLTEERQHEVLDSGLDVLLLSIDGVEKETHEKIRVNTKFERVVENCQSVIRKRDDGNYKTKIIVRFIRQESNYDQWEPSKEYWLPYMNPKTGDFIAVYDMHS